MMETAIVKDMIEISQHPLKWAVYFPRRDLEWPRVIHIIDGLNNLGDLQGLAPSRINQIAMISTMSTILIGVVLLLQWWS